MLGKELRSEFKTRYAVSAVALFVLTTVAITLFGTGGEAFSRSLASALLWIIMFFAAMTGLAKSFVSEEERGTALFLKVVSPPFAVYFGKLIFNVILAVALNALASFLFFLLFNFITIGNFPGFVMLLVLASVGLASSSTIISVLISKAGGKNALFPALSFPILLPLILMGAEASTMCFAGAPLIEMAANFRALAAYSGILITLSYFLFDFVWQAD